MQDAEARLQGVCSRLRVGDHVVRRAVQLSRDIWAVLTAAAAETPLGDSNHKTEETKYRLGVCLLYTLCIDAKFPYGTDDPSSRDTAFMFTVTQLLQTADISVIEFFKSMRSLREIHTVSKAVMTHLIALEKKFLITSPIYQKYERMMDDIFKQDDKSREGDSCDVTDQGDEKRLIWLLFIYAKELCLAGHRELFESYSLLLCCVDAVLQNTPAFKLKPPFDTTRMLASANVNSGTILEALCQTYTSDEQVSRLDWLKTSVLDPLIHNLKEEHSFDVSTLTASYEALYRAQGDIDETLFLQRDCHLGLHDNTKENAPTKTPPDTPVRSAMSVVESLHKLVGRSEARPSPQLTAIFKNCSMNPGAILEARVSTLSQTFTERYTHLIESHGGAGVREDVAARRADLAVRLFYKQLQTLLKKEGEKLSQKDFSHLLNNTTFTVCLLACSLQVVMASHSHNLVRGIQSPSPEVQEPEDFPWILDTCEIQAFDFLKVIESFIRAAEPDLHPAIVKHLHFLENRIVEELAWKKNSPLFLALERCQVPLPTIPQTPPAGSLPSHTPEVVKSAFAPHLYLSPWKPHDNISPAPQTPTRDVINGESPGKRPCKSQSLSLFFNRVCKLAYKRLHSLCIILNITKDMRGRIWTCLEYCLTRRWELLINRHLDQIVMCGIYAICKISDTEIKFKSIVAAYRHTPHSTQQVYKHIEIMPGEFDSIINFYNRVFMQKLKTYLAQFSLSPATPSKMAPLTHSPLTRAPMSPLMRQLTASPVVTLPGRNNFFISPLLDSPFKVPMSPRQLTPRASAARQTFNFGGEPGSSEKLKAINASLSHASPGGTQRSSHKRLQFDGDKPLSPSSNAEDATIPSKRIKMIFPASKSLDFSNPPADSNT